MTNFLLGMIIFSLIGLGFELKMIRIAIEKFHQ
jgi:hypothetical protein